MNNNGVSPQMMNQAANPNIRIWLVLSIVIPVVAIVWYFFIGLSVYLAILIAAVGLACAEKGKVVNKKLAILGMVLNGILIAIAIMMAILIAVTAQY